MSGEVALPDVWIVVGRDNLRNVCYPVTMRDDKSDAEVIATLRNANRTPNNLDTYVVMNPSDTVRRTNLPWNMIELLIKASSDVT